LHECKSKLSHVRCAANLTGLFASFSKGWEENCGENRYDGYHDEELDERERSVGFHDGLS
jgi:hypothetical protein